jgi:hypothetical protein
MMPEDPLSCSQESASGLYCQINGVHIFPSRRSCPKWSCVSENSLEGTNFRAFKMELKLISTSQFSHSRLKTGTRLTFVRLWQYFCNNECRYCVVTDADLLTTAVCNASSNMTAAVRCNYWINRLSKERHMPLPNCFPTQLKALPECLW